MDNLFRKDWVMAVTMEDMTLLAELEYEMFLKATLESRGGASVQGVEIADEILHEYFMRGVEWATQADSDVSKNDVNVEEEVIVFNIMSEFDENTDEGYVARQMATAAKVVFGYGAAWCIEHRRGIGDFED